MGVFNGDMGILREINTFSETARVEFEDRRFVEYTFKQLEELELAYAITIHKAQGSEYPAVVIPLLSGPRMLMNRNLIYTAVTRAKKCVTLVGDEKAFFDMVSNKTEQSRYTTLRQRLTGTFLKEEVRFHRGERMKFGRESGKKMDKRGGGRPDRSSVSSQMSPVRRYSDRAADCLLGLPEKRTADPGTAL